MIVIQIHNPEAVTNQRRKEISEHYGRRFDANNIGSHGLMIGCDHQGRWNNQEEGAVPGWFAFNLSVDPDPPAAVFRAFMEERAPELEFTIKAITEGRIKKPRRVARKVVRRG